jgi:uncharacterized protein YkwD
MRPLRHVLVMLMACAHLAATAEEASDCHIRGLRADVLERVNAARLAGARCGGEPFASAPPLAWSEPLQAAATAHSADMAQHDYFDHADPQGRRVGVRVTAQGYRWRAVGENIAGGDRSVDRVVRGWLASEGHCRNIMNPEFADIAVACVTRAGSTWGTYWTMVLGRRR